ncbi:MAG: ATP-dependent Clp protease ATP-binding subunit [Bacteroidota bacterium]|nr:ATP-dependent Clp protease ATP-binding subunit [Bacteroidota bacterium]
MANREANLAGSERIEPIHFLLATLKIIEGGFHQYAERLKYTSEVIQSIQMFALRGQQIFGLPVDEITTLRRALQKDLREGVNVEEIVSLHRSEESKTLFVGATRRALDEGNNVLNLVHLIEQLKEILPDDLRTLFNGSENSSPNKKLVTSSNKGDLYQDNIVKQSARLKRSHSIIDEIGRDLTSLARQNRLAPVVGRKKEMTTLVRYLQRTTKRNVILIGEAGVGKTAVVEGLAQRLVQENVLEFLQTLRIVQINVADLVAGTKYRGDIEQRLQNLIAEVCADQNLILFLDEIHLVIKGGIGGDSPMDIANILKPALAKDDFRCIGATTTNDYERYIKNDAAFMRRFQLLRIAEPTKEEAFIICKEWAKRIERLQQVIIEDESILSAIHLSVRYLRERALPDKAIDLLENAAAFMKVSSLTFHNVVPSKELPRIGPQHIEMMLKEQYGLVISRSEIINIPRIESVLKTKIVGQNSAIDEIVDTLKTLQVKNAEEEKPIMIFLFTGPTGVGKTYTAECLAEALYGEHSRAFARFNMNEYKERHELARLIGAPPGFVGHEHPGALFRFLESYPQGIILLDEFEKAHFEIQDYFLQIFDKGQAADSRGRIADFRSYVFILTCNVYSDVTQKYKIGFIQERDPQIAINTSEIHSKLLKHFRPEFLARVNQIINFQPFTMDTYIILLKSLLANLSSSLELEQSTTLEVNENLCDYLCKVCANQDEGARGFNRLFERVFIVPLMRHLKNTQHKKVVTVCLHENKLKFNE